MCPPSPGGYGVTERTLCYWNLVHGATVVLTAKQLGLSEDTVSAYYKLGRWVCAQDATRRQQLIKFGGEGTADHRH